jgi:hypothetical protein
MNRTIAALCAHLTFTCLVAATTLEHASAQDTGARALARPVTTAEVVVTERPSVEGSETVANAHRPDRGVRVLAGVGLGVGALVLATGLGYGVGASMPNDCTGAWICFDDHGLEGMLTGFSIGTALVPLAYSLGSALAGGRGNVWGASLGFVLGSAVSVGTIALGVLANDELEGEEGGGLLATAVVLGVLAPIVGTAIGYELTDRAAPPVVPTLALGRDRVMLGASGTF